MRCYMCCWYVFGIYLKSILRYQLLTFNTYNPATLPWVNKNMRKHGYFLETKRYARAQKSGKHWARSLLPLGGET